MKVLLINPVCGETIDKFMQELQRAKLSADEPLGPAYLSAYIKKTLPEVIIEVYDHNIDCLRIAHEKNKDVNKQDIVDLLKNKVTAFCPDIVGISALYYMNSPAVHETAAIVKGIAKDKIIVLGGIYPTSSPDKALSDKNIDYVVPGEAEIAFKEFLEYIMGKKELSTLKSIGYKNKDTSAIIYMCDAAIVNDINQLGFPDRSALPIGKYSVWGRNVMDRFYRQDVVSTVLQPTRGCPFLCTFCSGHVITRRRFRKRSVKDVVNEIKYLRDRYDINTFVFNDENANADPRWSTELYTEIIKEKLNIRWMHGGGFYTHLLNKELIEKAIESGIVIFNLAIESGSKRIMKMVKKSDKIIESAPKAVEMIRKAKPDLYITCFFLCGFPFETEQDITQTIDLAKSLDIEWAYFNMFQPFPGCELYEYCKKNDHINEFNTDNLSMYLSSKLKNTVIPAKKLEDIMYSANLLINFVNPRTIRNGNYAQALRDYERVIDVAPDHALAHYCLARTYKAMGINEKFKSELIKVIEISSKNDVQREYLTRFGINPLNLNK